MEKDEYLGGGFKYSIFYFHPGSLGFHDPIWQMGGKNPPTIYSHAYPWNIPFRPHNQQFMVWNSFHLGVWGSQKGMLFSVCSRVPLETIILDFWRPSTSIPVDPDKAKTLGPFDDFGDCHSRQQSTGPVRSCWAGGLEGWKKSNHYQ